MGVEMNFKEYYNLNERFGLNAMYVPPKDKQHQLYDFYALSLINPDAFMDEEAQDYFKQAKETIVDATYKDFVNAIFFSIASELFHMTDAAVFSCMGRQEIRESFKLNDKEMKFVEDMFNNKGSSKSRQIRNKIVRNYFSPQELANFATKVFADNPEVVDEYGEPVWQEGYGGEAWWKIAKGYRRLLDAKSLGDKMVAIDHIYDLQHNNDTVFDKVKEYYKDGSYSWLKKALDDKARIKEPHVYLDKTSPQLFRPLAYAFKQLYGKTIKGFKRERYDA